jgi:hypothetical protein
VSRREVAIVVDRIAVEAAPADPPGLRRAVACGIAAAVRGAPVRLPVDAVAGRASVAVAAAVAARGARDRGEEP